jgi:hypothetical protein
MKVERFCRFALMHDEYPQEFHPKTTMTFDSTATSPDGAHPSTSVRDPRGCYEIDTK